MAPTILFSQTKPLYLKELVDEVQHIVIARVVSVDVGKDGESNATAKVEKNLYGSQLKKIEFLAPKMGKTAILFLDKIKDSKKYKVLYAITRRKRNKKLYAELTIDSTIVYPYTVLKNSIVEKANRGLHAQDTRYVPMKILVDAIIACAKNEPVCNNDFMDKMRKKKFKTPNPLLVENTILKNDSLSDVDKSVICSGCFKTGLSPKAISFLLGKPDSIVPISEKRLYWKYNHIIRTIFLFEENKLTTINTQFDGIE